MLNIRIICMGNVKAFSCVSYVSSEQYVVASVSVCPLNNYEMYNPLHYIFADILWETLTYEHCRKPALLDQACLVPFVWEN